MASKSELFPDSVVIITAGSHLFGPENFFGDGANAHVEKSQVVVKAGLSVDATIHIGFELPPFLPSGSPKLKALALSDIEAGDAKFQFDWASYGDGESASGLTLNAEGIQTITWGAGDDDVKKILKIPLDADTVVLNEFIAMHIQFNQTGWTKLGNTHFIFSILWE